MANSPAPSGMVEMFPKLRPTPAILVQTDDLENSSNPQPIQEAATHDMFVNSFETVRPQVPKQSTFEMEVVIADIDQIRDDTTGQDECKMKGRNTDEQLYDGQNAREEARQHSAQSFTDKTVKQVYDDSATGMFGAWVVAQHVDDGQISGRSEYQRKG
ncbi:hypothetical protein QFC19_000417 [Naganishia cerealis]|uniref:Uncharacterized protein n=1 Tax=Naganishia cerealis TaxID=610337 RepID=A0ACC2WQN9_9TREE|nr:hypothetical protein QFC19_000417 [Naganishia cerealis]